MVEIEQEEFERLTNIEREHNELVERYNTLQNEHTELLEKHNSLKDDYIAICKGQQQRADNIDEFDSLCAKKFDNK